jgi:L-asparagine oxygenase
VERDAGFAHDHILELTEQEHTLLRTALDDLPSINVDAWDDELITEVELRSRYIPEHLAKLLSQFRKHSNDDGMLLLRNLPIDLNLPPTPEGGGISLGKTSSISEYVLLAIMQQLGEPIAYEDEKNGMLIQNICPVRGKEEMQENTGSTYLEFHTEDAFHPYRPDFVGLLCLRPDHERIAATAAASIRRAFAMLPGKTQELLRQPLYHIRLSSSFTSHTVFSAPLPVLRGDVLEPELSVDFYGMEALTSPAQLALKMLEEALLKVTIAHRLVTGDLMIVDNRVAAHARTAFTPRYDGQDRWLQRLFVVHDFRRSRASRPRGSHICIPLSIEFAAMDLEAQST